MAINKNVNAVIAVGWTQDIPITYYILMHTTKINVLIIDLKQFKLCTMCTVLEYV